MEFHEAANIFPLNEADVDAIAADIKANGQRIAIELLGGKIIDGRTRYQACRKLGVEPKTVSLESLADPVAYVLSLNLHRRQLEKGQISMIGARAREIYDKQAKERQKRKPLNSVSDPGREQNGGRAADKAGEAVGVSGRSIERATKVLKQGIPELVKAVEAGEIGVKAAAFIAELPPEEQREEIEKKPDPAQREEAQQAPKSEPSYNEARSRGKGVQLAHEAIAVLKRIPLKDPLAMDGFTIVMNWIKHNKHSYGGSNV